MGKYKTPLRYPGGKQRIAPFINEIIVENGLEGGEYVEPYAGGAGVAIELLLNDTVSRIHLNDSCPAVYSFWHSVIHESDELCHRISRASLTVEEWKKQREIVRNPKGKDRLDIGFAMFYLNRCNRSGILNAGIIGGQNQDGRWKMDARFRRNDLIQRIDAIAQRKNCIRIRNWDAEKFILKYIPKLSDRTLIYCDPPYFNKSEKLYHNHYTPEDHEHISNVIQDKIQHPWIVSYDSHPTILDYYKQRKHFIYSLQYNAANVYKGYEVFTFSDDLDIPEESSVSFINQSLEMLPAKI